MALGKKNRGRSETTMSDHLKEACRLASVEASGKWIETEASREGLRGPRWLVIEQSLDDDYDYYDA